MMIIDTDYHPSFQQTAFLIEETGEYDEQRLSHEGGEAERFYRDLKRKGIRVRVGRVGMEATGYSRWFERLLAELDFELWIGDPAEIEAKRVKKRKTDREDARLLLRLMLEDRFPRIWVPSPENRDLRQLLWHRHRLVQMRTRIMNQLQALAMNEGKRWKSKLFSQQGRVAFDKIGVRSVGQSTPERVVGAAGPSGSERRGVNDGRGAGSQKVPRSVAVDDASRRGSDYGTRLCLDHRNSGAVCSWQADRHVRGGCSKN
jgi:hypothetical protein